ncbi:MAG: hypothetical protein C0168_03235 [Candidatus Aminicenantes bacterium]|nr:MAG: hypothetical protein C0168_03235 [Candidatus Aminicenantes bacterium]
MDSSQYQKLFFSCCQAPLEGLEDKLSSDLREPKNFSLSIQWEIRQFQGTAQSGRTQKKKDDFRFLVRLKF